MNDTASRPIVVTESEFAEKVLRADRPVLVDFWAEWCGPCRALAPVVDALARDFAGRVTVAKVDVDTSQNVALRFGIRSIPTLMLFDNGQVVDTFVGVRPQRDYAASLENALG